MLSRFVQAFAPPRTAGGHRPRNGGTTIARHSTRVRVLTFLFFALVFAAMSRARLVDGDEGYLLAAAELVRRGAVPYRDFFLPQGPLMAYAYAFFTVGGVHWHGARLLSALFAATACTCVVVAIQRRGGGRAAQLAGMFLAATSAMLLCWAPIAKTYALAAALLGVAYVQTISTFGDRPSRRGFVFGLFLALAIGTRAYLLLAAPLFLVYFMRSTEKPRRGALRAATLGALIGSIPTLAVIACDPSNAFFGVYGIHAARSSLGLGDSVLQKLRTVATLCGLRSHDFLLGAQLTLPAVASGIVAWRHRASRGRLTPSLATFGLLAAISLLPTPAHTQYFVLTVPFAIEAAALAWEDVLPGLPRYVPVAVAAGAASIAVAAREVHRHTISGRGLVESSDAWRIASIEDVGRRIATLGRCGGVLVTWPGYLVGTSVPPWRGLENHFSTWAGNVIPAAETRRARHVVSTDDVLALLDGRAPALVVIGNWRTYIFGTGTARLRATLGDAGYRLVETRHGAAFWIDGNRRCDPRAP